MKKRSWIDDRLADIGGKKAELAVALGLPSSRVSEIIKGARRIRADEAEIIAKFLEMSLEEFMSIENSDTPRTASPAPKPAKAIGRDPRSQQQTAQIITDTSKLVSDYPDMPVYASAQGGGDGVIIDMAQIIEWVKTPAPLFGVKGAFGMYVIGDSMEPVYDQGDMLLIHPHKPVYKNDDVIVSMTSPDGGESRVLIKRLVKMTSDEVKLYQFNPAKEFSISRSEVSAINLVVGKYRRR